MSNTEFHINSTKRAEELAKRLGAEFNPVSLDAVTERVQKKIRIMNEYNSRKKEYDQFITNILETYSKEDVQAFIDAIRNPK